MAGRNRGRSGAGCGGAAGRRTWCRRDPACEVLEARALLSAAVSAGFLSPAAAVVAKAQAVISGGAAAEFARYQADLQQAEASSRVTPAAFANLKADDTSLVQAIERLRSPRRRSDPGSRRAPGRHRPGVPRRERQQLPVEPGVAATGSGPLRGDLHDESPRPGLHRHADRGQAGARHAGRAQAAASPTRRRSTPRSGPNVDTTLGGSVPRDPVVVYYDGQVTQFVHKR